MILALETEVEPTAWASIVQRLLDVLVAVNTHWYLREWSDRRDPPISPRGAGITWIPDTPRRGGVTFPDAPTIIRARRASCGSIAAMVAGAYAARSIARDPATDGGIDRALGWYGVELERQQPPAGSPPRSLYFHAVVRTPTGRVDPTKGMRRQAA